MMIVFYGAIALGTLSVLWSLAKCLRPVDGVSEDAGRDVAQALALLMGGMLFIAFGVICINWVTPETNPELRACDQAVTEDPTDATLKEVCENLKKTWRKVYGLEPKKMPSTAQ